MKLLTVVLLLGLIAQSLAVSNTPSVTAQAINTHGIGFAKGCDSPIAAAGDPYNCGFLIANTIQLDTAEDTMHVTSLVDVVHTASGDITSGNLLPTRVIAAYSGSAQCYSSGMTPVPVGGTGVTLCVLPSPSAVAFARAPMYTITAADVARGMIDDDATIIYEDQCTSGATDCPIGTNLASAGASADITAPTPTPVPPTSTPTVAAPTSTPVAPTPTVAPTQPPCPDCGVTPVSPTPPPATIPPTSPPASSPPGYVANEPTYSEVCHYEPSSGRWEIRRTTDLPGRLAQGDEEPMKPAVCNQHPTPVPTATFSPTSTAVPSTSTPVPPTSTSVPTMTLTATPTATTIPFFPTMTPTATPIFEEEPIVPVQIPW